ncbi:hypothetical protein E2C01_020425 [Portunus trituberculatus]|uniref:Uncharacterized protein n=1 Tax=Portunus trituberculatus TaxID=210409 RepID=A0A5B7E1N0_PORTR|nr:hypothetical protein [Portunus trituberculatus]
MFIEECGLYLQSVDMDHPKHRCLWCFDSASWGNLRRYYTDFPWNDYCFHVRDPSLCAEQVTEVDENGVCLKEDHCQRKCLYTNIFHNDTTKDGSQAAKQLEAK